MPRSHQRAAPGAENAKPGNAAREHAAVETHVFQRHQGPPMSDLYEGDILLWSEHQADLLRRRAAGELVNETELDWPNIAEQIEHTGGSLPGCSSFRFRAASWP
jgi:hypothetical protein